MSRFQAPAARRRFGRLAALFATALAAGSLSGAALAQAFPSRPVTLVVPFAAGGPTDVVARTLGQAMTRHLGQTVVVENTVGAGGTIAVNRVARAQPDGYTVLIHHNGMATAVGLYRRLTFNPLTDFEYIGQVADVPMTLLGKKTMQANTLPELIAYLKANKDKVTVANAGLGAGVRVFQAAWLAAPAWPVSAASRRKATGRAILRMGKRRMGSPSGLRGCLPDLVEQVLGAEQGQRAAALRA